MFLAEEIQELDKTRRWNPTFQMLHLDTRQLIENKTQHCSKLIQNRSLNRYRDVLPYDDTRVKLTTSSSDYINASYVEVPGVDRRYILAQGPLPTTCEDFWRMIWENNTPAVIMLNRIVEKNMIKCHPYWPMGEDEVLQFGDFEIVNQSTQMFSSYIIRELVVTYTANKEKQRRKINQYHFIMWPDFGVPQDPHSFLEFLDDIKKSGALSDPNCPPVVHCSAGIGRSGTFCLVDTALYMIERDGTADNIDVRDLLLSMRKCRCGLIQTAEQYRFANVAILNGIHSLLPNIDKFSSPVLETNSDEPPPLPPRRTKDNVPPPKPQQTTAQTEENQNKLYQDLTGNESSDEGSSEEEIIDLSDSASSSYTELLDIEDDVVDTEKNNDDTILESKLNDNTETNEISNESTISPRLINDTILENKTVVGDAGIEGVPIRSKASENVDLRHRLRETKKQNTKELIDNIKHRMKESEHEKPSASKNYILYASAIIGICSGISYAVYKWWS